MTTKPVNPFIHEQTRLGSAFLMARRLNTGMKDMSDSSTGSLKLSMGPTGTPMGRRNIA